LRGLLSLALVVSGRRDSGGVGGVGHLYNHGIKHIKLERSYISKTRAMNAIQQAKRALSSQLIFKLSQIGFALRSTLCYTNRINVGIHDYAEYAAQLRDGDSVFISTRESEVPVHTLVAILRARNVCVVFYIMEEPLVAWEFIERLLPVSIRILVQNNEYDHPKVGIMPIGIRDCGSIVAMHRRFDQKYLLEKGVSTRMMSGGNMRPIKCLLCFSVWTHPSRQECYHLFAGAPSFVYNLNDAAHARDAAAENPFEKVPVSLVYDKTLESRYALCPRGCGVDTHRFYESIYLGCVPIVVRTNTVFDRLYAAFPCLVVERWADVTEELLDACYPDCFARMRKFHARYPRFLTDLDSIEGLLIGL
jgi:hypothetical protein